MVLALLAALAAQAAAPAPAKTELVANLQWALGRPVDAEWQPLVLDLQSAAARDLDLSIDVHDEVSHARIVRRETLPAGGRRRLFLHLPSGRQGTGAFAMQPVLKVRGADGRELARFTLSSTGRGWSPDEILVGLVSPDPSPDSAFGLGWKAAGSNVEVARLAAEQIPDRWIGLAPLRLLLLHDAPLDLLSPDQAAALRDYVLQGGTLVVAPGAVPTIFSHPALAGIVEIRAGAAETRREIPALARRYSAFGARAPFRFIPFRNGSPIPNLEDTGIVRYEAGFGRVVALPFDLVKEPFAGWPGTARLMTDLILGARRADLEWAAGAGLPPELGQGVRRANVLARMMGLVNPYPSFLLLAALTVLYLAVVGPLNYMVLRRLRMTLLLVVTVPAISLLFLGLTLGLASLTKGGSTTLTSFRVLASTPGSSCARETRLTAVFSPSTRAYDIAPPPGRAALPADRSMVDPQGEDTGRAAPVSFEEGLSPRFKGVMIGQWQHWAFETRALADLGAGVGWELRDGRVRVRNGSGLAIDRALLVRAGRGGFASPVGPVAPGAEVEAPLDAGRWAPLLDLGFEERSLGARVLGLPLGGLRQRYQRDDGRPVVQQEEFLLCVLRDDAPGAEIDARLSGESRSLSLLIVRKERP